jgi:alpha-beta hydrolase superfamily lysophospholipase
MHVEPVMFPSGPVRCAGDLYLPEGVDGQAPAPAVVMGHSVIMVKEALGPHAEHLVRAGFVVLAVDYRTIGASEGRPRGQWLPERQVDDLRAGLSYLRTRPEVDPERIGLWGHSTGAGVAIMAGVLDRRVRCVAGQNPSMLDAWTALERSRGRGPLGAVRARLEQDFERRLATGEGATIPALATDDPKLAGYVAQSEKLFPTFRNQMTLESLEHVLSWAPLHFIHRLAPTPLLLVTGVDDPVHAVDEVLRAYHRAWEPKRLELLPVDELGLSIEPGLGQSMGLAAEFFDQHLRKAPRFVPSPSPEEAWSRGLRPEYQTATSGAGRVAPVAIAARLRGRTS